VTESSRNPVTPDPNLTPEAKGSEVIATHVDDKDELNQEAHRLLAPFGFVKRNKREMWEAFKANPEGVERCALLAKAKAQREGRSGAGLLLTMIRAGEHLVEVELEAPMPTGWRWVRSEQSGTYVQDPEGTDRLPPGYDFATRNPLRYQTRQEEALEPMADGVKAELERLAGRRRESEAVERYERL
jgi:hypothetical protein